MRSAYSLAVLSFAALLSLRLLLLRPARS